jgi:hypothetical protein
MRVEVELLEDHADLSPERSEVCGRVTQRPSVHDDLALANRLELIDATDERALARSARPAHDYHLSRPDLQINIAKNMRCPKPFIDPPKGDHKDILIALFGRAVNNEVEEPWLKGPLGREASTQLEVLIIASTRRVRGNLKA